MAVRVRLKRRLGAQAAASLKLAVRGQLLEHRLQLLVGQLLPRLCAGRQVATWQMVGGGTQHLRLREAMCRWATRHEHAAAQQMGPARGNRQAGTAAAAKQ